MISRTEQNTDKQTSRLVTPHSKQLKSSVKSLYKNYVFQGLLPYQSLKFVFLSRLSLDIQAYWLDEILYMYLF